MKTIAIILAGGLGKRMKSTLPKILHLVGNKPMLVRVILEARKLNASHILIVVGQYKQIIEETILKYTTMNDIDFCIQESPLGTGHALMCCTKQLKLLNHNSKVVILQGDCPLITAETIKPMLNLKHIKVMTLFKNEPSYYGRIIEQDNKFLKIVEAKDCTPEEYAIKNVNCGIYSFINKYIIKYVYDIKNNNSQNEYYLTDLIEIIKIGENIDVETYNLPSSKEIELTNVNDQKNLKFVNEYLSRL